MSFKTSFFMLALLALIGHAGSAFSQPSADVPDGASPPPVAAQDENPPHKKLFPDDVVGLQKMAIEAYENGEYLRFVQATIKLREQRPKEPQYMVGMVIGAARLGRTNTAYHYMHIMQQQGLSYDFSSTEDTESIRNTEAYDYLNDLLIKAGEPSGEGRVAFTLPAASVQPEALAWDESRGKFLVGTIESGSLLAVSPAGEVQELLHANDENGLLAISGIAVDQGHQRLWIATAGVPGFAAALPTELGRGALLEFNLETLELVHRYDVPVDGLPHVPGSVAVTPAGDVYLLDRAVPMVFRKQSGAQKLEPYLAVKDMAGFTDLALSTSGEKLYLADAALGISVIDLKANSSTVLSGPESMNLSGISGLMFEEGQLLVLQNGIRPQRLLRLELDAAGLSVVNVVPLAVALEAFDAPAYGTTQGGAVYYFARGNVAGVKRESMPVTVLKTPVILSQAIVPVEQRKFDADRLKEQQRSKAAAQDSNP